MAKTAGGWSPIRISERSGDTFDKNVLKFILAGVDDTAVVTTTNVESQRTANLGKVEIIDEMIAAAQQQWDRDFPGELDLDDRSDRLTTSIEELQTTMSGRQSELDELRLDRRSKVESLRDAQERWTEISLSLDRFSLLRNVYESDLQRLASLEEGGAALLAGARRPCPLCGAEPSHQRHAHGIGEVELTQRAVRAETAKIISEGVDLVKTTRSLEAEQEGLQRRVERLTGEIEGLDAQLVTVNPKLGTPAMVKTPLWAIDVPPKALVWEDDQGKVWLSYNSSDYLYNTIYPRHGAAVPPATAPFAKLLDEMSDQATK